MRANVGGNLGKQNKAFTFRVDQLKLVGSFRSN
jgi:hypothetical protein